MDFLNDEQTPKDDPWIAHTDDVPLVNLSERDDVTPDVSVRPVDEVLGLTEMGAKLWYFEPGDEIGYHAHPEEEELYYVVHGHFSLKLGDPDDPTYETVGPGTFYAAGPYEPHGHRCVGDEQGIILAVGAPGDASDAVLDPHQKER
jgi:quercetin dioxygenase-like cupin family protein